MLLVGFLKTNILRDFKTVSLKTELTSFQKIVAELPDYEFSYPVNRECLKQTLLLNDGNTDFLSFHIFSIFLCLFPQHGSPESCSHCSIIFKLLTFLSNKYKKNFVHLLKMHKFINSSEAVVVRRFNNKRC